MTLQEAVDTAHDIRDNFDHVIVDVVATERTYRNGDTVYILGIRQGTDARNVVRSWVLSSTWEYRTAIYFFKIFANAPGACDHP